MTCPISLEEISIPFQLECGHIFDIFSIYNFLFHDNKLKTCPLCRKVIDSKKRQKVIQYKDKNIKVSLNMKLSNDQVINELNDKFKTMNDYDPKTLLYIYKDYTDDNSYDFNDNEDSDDYDDDDDIDTNYVKSYKVINTNINATVKYIENKKIIYLEECIKQFSILENEENEARNKILQEEIENDICKKFLELLNEEQKQRQSIIYEEIPNLFHPYKKYSFCVLDKNKQIVSEISFLDRNNMLLLLAIKNIKVFSILLAKHRVPVLNGNFIIEKPEQLSLFINQFFQDCLNYIVKTK